MAEVELVEEEDGRKSRGAGADALGRRPVRVLCRSSTSGFRPKPAMQLGEIEDGFDPRRRGCRPTLSIKVADKQALLGELNPLARLEMVFAFMEGELGVLQVEKKIRSRVKRQMEKTQREYYLNEQLKAIQRELGESEERRRRAQRAGGTRSARPGSSKEARAARQCRAEEAARHGADVAPEATVARNYLDVLLGLPWGKKSKPQEGHRRGAAGPRRGSLRAGEGEGPHRRISRGPGPHQLA